MITFSWIVWFFTVIVLSWILGIMSIELGVPIKYTHLEDNLIIILIRGFVLLLLIFTVLKIFI